MNKINRIKLHRIYTSRRCRASCRLLRANGCYTEAANFARESGYVYSAQQARIGYTGRFDSRINHGE